MPLCPALCLDIGQGCTGHPQHSSHRWVTPLHGGLFLPITSRNRSHSACSWHSSAQDGTLWHGRCWRPCIHGQAHNHTPVQAPSARLSFPPSQLHHQFHPPPGRAQPGPTQVLNVPGLSPSATEVAHSHPCQAGSARRQAGRGLSQPALGKASMCLGRGWQGEPAMLDGGVTAPPAPQNTTWSHCADPKAPTSCASDPWDDILTSPPAHPKVGHGWVHKPHPWAPPVLVARGAMGCAAPHAHLPIPPLQLLTFPAELGTGERT